mmetsp:Transcript_2296/g.3520  ORF Transcript_2296/g.3520 Transcript_2296/m.3520 type:complete len:918 (-) Transcript_2296:32-2785(-)
MDQYCDEMDEDDASYYDQHDQEEFARYEQQQLVGENGNGRHHEQLGSGGHRIFHDGDDLEQQRSRHADEQTHTTDESEQYDAVQPLFSETNEGGFANDYHHVDTQVDEDNTPISKRHPCLACSCVLLLIVCLGGVAGGVFFYFLRGEVSGSVLVSEDDFIGTDTGSGNGFDATSSTLANSIGVIKNGTFRSLENQPLPATLPVFDPANVGMYTSCDELREDLKNALHLVVNEDILSRAVENYASSYYNYPVNVAENEPSDNLKSATEDSYGTNNQVPDIDEADVVKSTVQHVFAAYGDQLVVWEAKSGKKISVTKMKEKEQTSARSHSRIFLGPQGLQIRGLMLHGDRLLVIADGYKHDDDTPRILQGRGKTMIHLYNINSPDLPTNGDALVQISSKEVHGEYRDARMVGNTIHLVTIGKVNLFYHLRRFLSREQERFKGLNRTEYLETSIPYAGALLVPSFIERIMDELGLENNSCGDIVKMSVYRTADDESTVPSVGSIINGFIEITSFDLHGSHSATAFESKTLGSFTADVADIHGSIMYASGETLVIANRGYQFDSSTKSWTQNTFVTTFSIRDSYLAGAKILGAAQLPGYLLNQYSIDIWDGHLRLASTINSRWGCTYDDEKDSTHKYCIWQMLIDSDNFISVYEVPTDNQGGVAMRQAGFLNGLGEEQEIVEAVRFMKDKGWIVTFLRTDPLYSLDLSDHSSPQVKGELKVTGYSNYLHPYDDEGKYIIGVGQDADKDGRATGLQISLYNVADLAKPNLVHRYNAENADGEDTIISSSAAQYDPKAFRFLPQSKILIIPTTIRATDTGETFDGFNIFHVAHDDSGIAFRFSISHYTYDKKEIWGGCWYDAYLRPRSLVHANIVTTIKGHTVLTHDLSTKEMKWKLNLDSNNTDCNNKGYWVSQPQPTIPIL